MPLDVVAGGVLENLAESIPVTIVKVLMGWDSDEDDIRAPFWPDPICVRPGRDIEGGPLSRVLITGSSDGLGLMAGQLLAADGHSVTLHARNQARAEDTRAALSRAALPQVDGVVIGDLSSIAGMRQVRKVGG